MTTISPTHKRRRVAKRPQRLASTTYTTEMTCGTFIVTISKLENGRIFEVFARTEQLQDETGYKPHCIQALLDGLSKTISIALRAGVPLQDLVKTLNRTACTKQSFIPDRSPIIKRSIYSCVDLLAQFLKDELPKDDDTIQTKK